MKLTLEDKHNVFVIIESAHQRHLDVISLENKELDSFVVYERDIVGTFADKKSWEMNEKIFRAVAIINREDVSAIMPYEVIGTIDNEGWFEKTFIHGLLPGESMPYFRCKPKQDYEKLYASFISEYGEQSAVATRTKTATDQTSLPMFTYTISGKLTYLGTNKTINIEQNSVRDSVLKKLIQRQSKTGYYETTILADDISKETTNAQVRSAVSAINLRVRSELGHKKFNLIEGKSGSGYRISSDVHIEMK